MNDGLLYLAARLYAEKAEAIRAETDAMMAEAVKFPDCGESEAEVFVDGEIALDELRDQFPRFVVDVVEGVDNDICNVDRLTEAFDESLEELPF